ncbi:MAG: molecular chaperone [Alphaproteobacteria bacterium]|nr:molecular chaperone [Alphaproteobacteria bacterium]
MRLFFTIFLGSFFYYFSAQAGFLIFPQKLIFEGKDKKQSVKITNMTDIAKSYRIKVVNYHQSEDGGYKKVTEESNGDKFAENTIRFSPKKVTLQPRETQTINVMVKNKNSLADGEYRSYLSVLEKESSALEMGGEVDKGKMGFQITADYGLTIPVIIRKGVLSLEIDVKGISIDEDKDGNAFISLTLLRKGERSFRGEIKVFDGKDEIGCLKNFTIYPNLSQRKIDIKLFKREEKSSEAIEISDIKSGKVRIEIQEDTKENPVKIVKELEL